MLVAIYIFSQMKTSRYKLFKKAPECELKQLLSGLTESFSCLK